MKNVISFIFFVAIISGCTNQPKRKELNSKTDAEQKTTLEYINRWNQIELAHTDAKYGEWGGDSDVITIYSDGKTLYANYSRYLGSTSPPMPPKENEEVKKWFEYKELDYKIDSIELDNRGIHLVENAILELVKQKIDNQTFISHSGIRNSVIARDSSLIIEDYPSGKWTTFQKLKDKLTVGNNGYDQ